MSTAMFIVEQAGPLTTIQDVGRTGFMRYGVPRSGPMDRSSFAIVQAALNLPAQGAAIETTLGGLTLRCIEGSVNFAVAGGGFRIEFDGEPMESWMVSTIRAGSRLSIKAGHWGSWTYLAFDGAIAATEWLGSKATHALSGFGGGRIAVGQMIEVKDAQDDRGRCGAIPYPAAARPRSDVRVILGPQDRFFAQQTIAALLAQPFTLTSEYDRMGVRLKGSPLPMEGSLDMVSEPLVRGAIQVPGHGDPIVLLSDHQTTAGYPKVATIATVDQDAFVQLRTRQTVTFRAISPETAIEAARTRQLITERFLERVRRRDLHPMTSSSLGREA